MTSSLDVQLLPIACLTTQLSKCSTRVRGRLCQIVFIGQWSKEFLGCSLSPPSGCVTPLSLAKSSAHGASASLEIAEEESPFSQAIRPNISQALLADKPYEQLVVWPQRRAQPFLQAHVSSRHHQGRLIAQHRQEQHEKVALPDLARVCEESCSHSVLAWAHCRSASSQKLSSHLREGQGG